MVRNTRPIALSIWCRHISSSLQSPPAESRASTAAPRPPPPPFRRNGGTPPSLPAAPILSHWTSFFLASLCINCFFIFYILLLCDLHSIRVGLYIGAILFVYVLFFVFLLLRKVFVSVFTAHIYVKNNRLNINF